MKYLFIGLGGFIGAVLRYLLESAKISSSTGFPVNTFIINLLGSLLIGLMLASGFQSVIKNNNIRLGLTTGFLGAFTTFSTFTYETIKLMDSGMINSAFLYIVATLACGIIAVKFGNILGQLVFRRS